MLFLPTSDDRLDQLARRLRLAENPTAELIEAIVSEACPRASAADGTSAAARRLEALSKSAAWTELALALIVHELPAWSVRRLVFEDGAWLCSLSARPAVPIELDDTVDATHESMPLAMLGALIEVRRKRSIADQRRAKTVPRVELRRQGYPVCCENFA